MSTGAMAGPDAAEVLPDWECWTGADRQFYARLRGSTPPVVLRGADWADLRAQVQRYALVQLL